MVKKMLLGMVGLLGIWSISSSAGQVPGDFAEWQTFPVFSGCDCRSNPPDYFDTADTSDLRMRYSQLYARADDSRFQDIQAFLAWSRLSGDLQVALHGGEAMADRVNWNRFEESQQFHSRHHVFEQFNQSLMSLLAQQSDVLVASPQAVQSLIDAGVLRPLLTFLYERPYGFPQVPSIKDVDPGVESVIQIETIKAL